jgi:thermostable 8-oxoguanine DNA glycosylase
MSNNKPINAPQSTFKTNNLGELQGENDCFCVIIVETGFEVYKKSNLRATSFEKKEEDFFDFYESKEELREDLPEITEEFLKQKEERISEAKDEMLELLKNEYSGENSRSAKEYTLKKAVGKSDEEFNEALESLKQLDSVKQHKIREKTRYKYVEPKRQ